METVRVPPCAFPPLTATGLTRGDEWTGVTEGLYDPTLQSRARGDGKSCREAKRG